MTYPELVAAVEAAGLDANRLVDRVRLGRTASENIAYSIVDTPSGLAVLGGMGRGELTELPDDGYRFGSEDDVCDFVWRHIRSNAAPELLSDKDKDLLRQEAADSVARQTAAYEAEHGE
jgi:hypothetical protein